MVASSCRIASISGTSIVIIAAYNIILATIIRIARFSIARAAGKTCYRIMLASISRIAAVVSTGIAIIAVNINVLTS